MGNEAASPESVLGQLQRGRGLGFLRALEQPRPDARRLLMELKTSEMRPSPESRREN